MLSEMPEREMHRIRWLLTIGWLLLIVSLFYDPISSLFTEPDNTLSPLKIDPTLCIEVQGICLKETPYAFGAQLFWGTIIPSAIFILLIFGARILATHLSSIIPIPNSSRAGNSATASAN